MRTYAGEQYIGSDERKTVDSPLMDTVSLTHTIFKTGQKKPFYVHLFLMILFTGDNECKETWLILLWWFVWLLDTGW